MARSRSAISVAVLTLLAVGVGTAAAQTQGDGPQIVAVEPALIVDDPNPPPVPEAKAAAVTNKDLPRDGSAAAEPHTGHDDPGGDEGDKRVDWANDPNVWVCTGPDDLGQAIFIDRPSLEILETLRARAVEQRELDPTWMPLVEYDAAPPGCEPIEGKPSLEDFYRDRTILAVLHDDGSIKNDAELAAQELGS